MLLQSKMQRNGESEQKLPSFSIIFETENLSSVELENIYLSLDSLVNQDIEIKNANEFLIIDGGYAPDAVVDEIKSQYPWITFYHFQGITYHEAKMMGARLATGEVVVICDSDCIYDQNWLRSLLTPFANNSDVNSVAGETSTLIRNPYELAIAMNYLFPRFSNRLNPYQTQHYHLNSVAFRRQFILANPIPCELPLYRGHCKVHVHQICKLKNYTILKHPQAKALHEPPTLQFISWRYLLMGHDASFLRQMSHLLGNSTTSESVGSRLGSSKQPFTQRLRGFLGMLLRDFKPRQAVTTIQEDPKRLIMLPLAIPFILWFRFLFTVGRVITDLKPGWLLEIYSKKQTFKPNKSLPTLSQE
jgi:Glycosyl transferase family 2